MMEHQKRIDTAGIAAILGYSVRHVRDQIAKRPDFPRPAVNLSQRHRLWNEVDVLRWRDTVSQAA